MSKQPLIQATRLQNYQMQPQQQFHRQRQMEIIDSGQIQRQQIINATTVNKNIPLHFQEHQQQPQLSQAYKEHPEMIVPSNVVHSQQIYGQSGQVLTPHPMVEGMQMQPIKTQPSIRIRQTGYVLMTINSLRNEDYGQYLQFPYASCSSTTTPTSSIQSTTADSCPSPKSNGGRLFL
jgi:hypothetical protein